MGGVRLLDVLERAQPSPEARFVLYTSYGLDQFSYGGQPRRRFYEVIDLEPDGSSERALSG